MKILAVQLLRLGDIFLTAPALHKLKLQQPDCELHILVNKQFSIVEPLLPFVDKFHYFDRKEFQNQLGNPNLPILLPFDRLKAQIQSLNAESFNALYNFTQNQISAHISAAIKAEEKFGMVGGKGSSFEISGEYFQLMNKLPADHSFHYTQLFLNAVGASDLSHNWLGGSVSFEKKHRVCIQPFANTNKKEWSAASWSKMLRFLRKKDPMIQILAICAPDEINKMNSWVDELDPNFSDIKTLACSLVEARDIIAKSKVLVTVDTSIKHLANTTETPIIELALGSSQPHQTGAFKQNSVIFSGSSNCFPCSYSGSCSQQTHACGESVSPMQVSRAVLHSLNDTEFTVSLNAENQKTQSIGRVSWQGSGKWSLKSLTSRNLIEQLQKKMSESVQALDFVNSSVGDQAFQISENISYEISPTEKKLVEKFLVEKESHLQKEFSQLEKCSWEFTRLLGTDSHEKRRFKLAEQVGVSLDSVERTSFVQMRSIQIGLKSKLKMTERSLKLTRNIKSNIRELL